uniref:Clip domain-containing protein n=1 Tax=Rodentolepis nana TaxID=102285 RepID=A0A0R3T7X9_RODNA
LFCFLGHVGSDLSSVSCPVSTPIPAVPTQSKLHQTSEPLKLTVETVPITLDPAKVPYHPSACFFLPCSFEPKSRCARAFVKYLMKGSKRTKRLKESVASTSVLPSSISESRSESGSMGSFGEPQRDPMTHTMREPAHQQKKHQDPHGRGRFSNSNTPVSPIAALLRGKMEKCGRYANYGDIDECVDCIMDEDKKLKSLKKQKAVSFCQNKKYQSL